MQVYEVVDAFFGLVCLPAAGAGSSETSISAAAAAAGGGKEGRGERIRRRAGPRADAQAYGAAAAACARGHDHKAAVRLLGAMREAGLKPGRPMFGAVIDACARRGKWEQAVALLEVKDIWTRSLQEARAGRGRGRRLSEAGCFCCVGAVGRALVGTAFRSRADPRPRIHANHCAPQPPVSGGMKHTFRCFAF